MTNLDSIFKSRDITLPTKVHLVKAMVFPRTRTTSPERSCRRPQGDVRAPGRAAAGGELGGVRAGGGKSRAPWATALSSGRPPGLQAGGRGDTFDL